MKYQLIKIIGGTRKYTIIDFNSTSWINAKRDESNWFASIGETVDNAIEYKVDRPSNNYKMSMGNFQSPEEFCKALRDSPDHISPEIVLEFDNLKTLHKEHPELFI